MKQYMLILHGPANYNQVGFSPEKIQERMGQWFAWTEKMQKQGVMLGGEALHPEAKLISGPDRTVSDRAAGELKELVGGFYLIQADSMDQVIEISQGFPDYDINGTVEIREVMKFD